MPRESNQTALATHAFKRLARAFVSSQREPHAETKWQTLDRADKEILEQVSTLRGRLFKRTTLFEIWIETQNCNPPCAKASSCWLPRASVIRGYFADSC